LHFSGEPRQRPDFFNTHLPVAGHLLQQLARRLQAKFRYDRALTREVLLAFRHDAPSQF
jgi:hypothetical protein